MKDHTGPAVRLARDLARQLYCSKRSVAPWGVNGLNSEGAVRARLATAVDDLGRYSHLEPEFAAMLSEFDVANDIPLNILTKTEVLITCICRDRFRSVDALVHDADPIPRLATRLLLIQSVAGRLGQWAVKADEIPDARTAHGLTRDLGPIDWSHYCTLVDQGARSFDDGEFRLAALAYLGADRLVRAPVGLIHASACLCHVGDYVGALWAIRACLLEPENTFESDAALARARTLEERLATLLEGQHAEPLDGEEVAFERLPIHGTTADTAEMDIEVCSAQRVLDQRNEPTQLIRTLRRPRAPGPNAPGVPRRRAP